MITVVVHINRMLLPALPSIQSASGVGVGAGSHILFTTCRGRGRGRADQLESAVQHHHSIAAMTSHSSHPLFFQPSSPSSCTHLFQQVKPPTYTTAIHKTECTQCYTTDVVQYDVKESIDDTVQSLQQNSGLFVCLTCYNGSCLQHLQHHYTTSKHSLYANIRRIPLQQAADSKLANLGESKDVNDAIQRVAAQEQQNEPQYQTLVTIVCLACHHTIDTNSSDAPALKSALNKIQESQSATTVNSIGFTEDDLVLECQHVQSLQQSNTNNLNLSDRASIKCNKCDLTSNLWLCLTCGNLGCGRQQIGGADGNSHALEHYSHTQHAVALKVGTIKLDDKDQLTGDLYCYTDDNTVLDSQLTTHLKTFGISNETQITATEKSTSELSLQHNLQHNWNLVLDDNNESAELVYGQGYTGLKNLGNTCYMASVIQVLINIPEFREYYFSIAQTHLSGCTEIRPAECYLCQVSKLVIALSSGQYSPTPTDEQLKLHQQYQQQEQREKDDAIKRAKLDDGAALDGHEITQLQPYKALQPGISPAMFKKLIAGSHSEFSTARQQDSYEYMKYLLEQLQRNVQPAQATSSVKPNELFTFTMEERLQCTKCQRVRYKQLPADELSLHVPQADQAQLLDSINRVFEPNEIDYNCPHCLQKTKSTQQQRFVTYPSYLMLHLHRFTIDKTKWAPVKLDTRMEYDERELLELTQYRGKGQQADEVDLPADSAVPAAATPSVQPDEMLVIQLVSMGFADVPAQNACIAVNNSGMEQAMNWLLEHTDDPSIHIPYNQPRQAAASPSTASSVNEESVVQLQSMGFDADRCKFALQQCDGSVERAVDWLFSHMEVDITAEQASASTQPSQPAKPSVEYDTQPARYELISYITHLGKSTSSGHYVAHIRKYDEATKQYRWILFNDNKVSVAKESKHPYAYQLMFRRIKQ